MGMMSIVNIVSSSLLRIRRSNNLDNIGRRLLGLYEIVSVGGFPGFAIIIIFLGVRSGRLTTLPPSVNRISGNVGASTSSNPKGLHGLYRDNDTFLPFY
jgi:hypothetical protein